MKLAVDLLHFPARAQFLRTAALPDGVFDVIRVATGDSEAISEAAQSAGRSRDVIRQAAGFFVEQVLLFPGADSYRVLGAKPDATYDELRRNMALLLRWLHPDRGGNEERAVFASKITKAWDQVKTTEGRAAYDQSLRQSQTKFSGQSAKTRPARRGGVKPRSVNRQTKTSMQRSKRYDIEDPRLLDAFNHGSFFRRLLMLLFGRAAP